MTTHNITLDLDKTLRTPPPLVTARQGDTQCDIAASVADHGAPASLAGYTARFQAAKPDGTYADQTADIDGSTVSVTLAPEFLAAEGLIKTAYFRFFEGADEKESTQNLFIRVLHDAEGESPDPTGDYVSAVDDLIAEVQGALDDVNGAVEDASEATDAANSAASSANTAASNANAAALDADAAAEAAQSALGAMTGNVLKGETEAGAVASAGDAYAQTPLGLKVYGETRQNRWSNPEGSQNGIAVAANADGSMTVSGTSTDDVSIDGVKSYVLKPSTQYAISVDSALSSGSEASGGSFFVRFHGSDGVEIADSLVSVGYGSVTSMAFTTPAAMSYAVFGVMCASGATLSGTYRVMLNEGPTAEPWCPPGLNSVDELSLVTAGKNLLPSVTPAQQPGLTIVHNEDGSYTVNGTPTAGYVAFVQKTIILPPGTYRIGGGDPAARVYPQISFVVGGNTRRYSRGSFTIDRVVEARYTVQTNSIADTGTLDNVTVYPQLELGSTATDYEPPNVNTTPIDLQGHELCSLPDGTRDVLVIGQDGTATVESACGYVESYTDENVGEDYVASALDADGGIAQGAQVVYKLDAAQSSTVPSVALPSLPAPNFNAWVQPGECEVAGDVSAEYAKDVNLVVGSLEERVSALEQLHAGGGE